MKEHILTIHQPAFCPWIGFFHKVYLSDTLVYLDSVQLEKNSFQNRNRVLVQGKAHWLTVPIKMKGHIQKSIGELEINSEPRFKKKMLQTLQMNYSKTPFFKEYFPEIEKLLLQKEFKLLSELNVALNTLFFNFLDLKPKIFFSSKLCVEGSGTDLLLGICQRLSASHYIAGGRGKEYLQEEKFDQAGVRVFHHNYKPNPYEQGQSDFVPYLSILDLLFRLGPASMENILGGNPGVDHIPGKV